MTKRKANPTPLKGNKSGTKIKDPELRQEAYRQYCAHLSKGFSKQGWKFVHPHDPLKSLTHRTMERYLSENPTEFPPILKEMAEADSFRIFEEHGLRLMRGEYKGGSPETWKTIMRNKFGWDKEDKGGGQSYQPLVVQLLKEWEK
ncbi:hypothetical protein HC928_02455 [bacterium]|nr:hypothetical protein [bacterium]